MVFSGFPWGFPLGFSRGFLGFSFVAFSLGFPQGFPQWAFNGFPQVFPELNYRMNYGIELVLKLQHWCQGESELRGGSDIVGASDVLRDARGAHQGRRWALVGASSGGLVPLATGRSEASSPGLLSSSPAGRCCCSGQTCMEHIADGYGKPLAIHWLTLPLILRDDVGERGPSGRAKSSRSAAVRGITTCYAQGQQRPLRGTPSGDLLGRQQRAWGGGSCSSTCSIP